MNAVPSAELAIHDPASPYGGEIAPLPSASPGGAAAVITAMQSLKMVRTFVADELKPGLDYGKIPGTGDKMVMLLPGAQKVAMLFDTFPDYEIQSHEIGNGHVEYILKTRLISRRSGGVVGAGIGSCSTMEKKYRYRTAARVCPHCGKDTLRRSKDDRKPGWYCWAKLDGCGATFRPDDPAITDQSAGQVENPDIYDLRNTVLKIAKKRSLVDASIGLGCLAEMFTQDLDDVYDLTATVEPSPVPPRNTGRPGSAGPPPTPAAEPAPTPPKPWAAVLAAAVNDYNQTWANDQAIANVPPDQRTILIGQEHATNGLAKALVRVGKLPEAAVLVAGKPVLAKARAAILGLYKAEPDWTAKQLRRYLWKRLKEQRATIGLDEDGNPLTMATQAEAIPAEEITQGPPPSRAAAPDGLDESSWAVIPPPPGASDSWEPDGKALFHWVKAMEARFEVRLLKYLNGFGKLQEFPARMVDYSPDQVALAHAEAIRKLKSIRPSGDADEEALAN